MKKLVYLVAISLFFCVAAIAQEAKPSPSPASDVAKTDKPKKPSFRATKDQVMQVQKILKVAESGKNDPATKDAVKKYQTENGLKSNGSLNRQTLEKMGIELTDKQKAIPVKAEGMGKSEKTKDSSESGDKKPRKAPFRASKEQVMQVQKMLKVEETGKLDDTTREAIKKYQDANGVKVTGTLNKETLVKMGVELTDKQKEY
jgi:murein L,D-transpeptidase YcbB/YkuD